jgi:hypothetical protein
LQEPFCDFLSSHTAGLEYAGLFPDNEIFSAEYFFAVNVALHCMEIYIHVGHRLRGWGMTGSKRQPMSLASVVMPHTLKHKQLDSLKLVTTWTATTKHTWTLPYCVRTVACGTRLFVDAALRVGMSGCDGLSVLLTLLGSTVQISTFNDVPCHGPPVSPTPALEI